MVCVVATVDRREERERKRKCVCECACVCGWIKQCLV